MLAVKDEAVKLWRERDPIQLDPADLPIKSGFPPSVGHCDADHPRLPISQWFGISPVGPFEAQLQVKGRRRWGSGQFMWFMCETANLAKRGASLKAENVKLEANSSIYSTWQHAVDLSPLIHNQSILIQRCQVTRQFRTIDEPRRCADEEAVRALEGWQSWLRWQTAPYSPFISHCLIWLVGSAQVGHSKSKAGSAKIKKGLSFYHGVPFSSFFSPV